MKKKLKDPAKLHLQLTEVGPQATFHVAVTNHKGEFLLQIEPKDARAMKVAGLDRTNRNDCFVYANHLLGNHFETFDYTPTKFLDNHGRSEDFNALQQMLWELKAAHGIAFETRPYNEALRVLANSLIPRIEKLLVKEQNKILLLTGSKPKIY